MERTTTTWETLLDRSILFSYDRSGYERHARSFSAENTELDLTGRICLVTGANSGIGKAAARGLAERGAEVWMLCRDEVRGQAARAELIEQTGNEAIRLATIDLSELSSVRRFARDFPRDRVDVLVQNAGVLPGELEITADGLELTVATNLVGPFLLAWLLRGKLRAADEGRLIFVTSGGMYPRKLSVDRLRALDRRFNGVTAYADTKRALVVLTEQLAERFADSSVTVHATHPGWVDTPAVRSSLPRFWKATRSILRTPEQGADTVVWLAASRAAGERSGELWFDRSVQPRHLLPWTREDRAERDELWRQLCAWVEVAPDDEWTE